MTPLEQDLTRLTDIWCRFVGQDHHKDRDCHWYVSQRFSYGEPPYFIAYHHGYVAEYFEGSKCTTIEEAQQELKDKILFAIHDAEIWVERNYIEAKALAPEDRWDEPEFYEAMLDILHEALEFGADKK
jgi:hypothetical protein